MFLYSSFNRIAIRHFIAPKCEEEKKKEEKHVLYIIFTIYLEHALKEVRPTLPRPTTSFDEEIPNEVAYADDVDFIGQNYADIKKIQEVLKKYQLKVNTDKTEYISISKSEEGWKEVKKSRIT